MAMEVVCGNCQGRLLVEHTGVVVACPHCGAHLQIGEPTPPAAQVPPPVETPPAPQFAPPQPEPVAPPVPPASPFGDFNPAAFNSAPAPSAPPPAPPPPPPVFTPPPLFEPPPVVAAPPATAEFSPFPASFGSQAAAAPNPPPGPLFPEIVLTPPPVTPEVTPPPAPPPAPLITPTVATTPEPVPAPTWDPPQFGFPSQPTASDSWMPQINLEMPAAVATPAPVPEPAPAPVEPPPAPPLAVPETATTLSPAMPTVDASPSTVNLSPPPGGTPANQTDIWNPVRVEESRAEVPTMGFPGAEPAFSRFGNFTPAPAAATSIPPAAPAVMATPAPAQATVAASVPAPAATSNAVPAFEISNAARQATVPRAYFILVASYASAITIAFFYIYWRASIATIDLPDIKPQIDKNGQYGLSWVDEKPLPAAFRLKLGESKRYGNLMVTPVKVTKGKLEFVHFGDEKQTKPATQTPVLKLWVKFENVSSDQTFPVLDEQLLFQRVRDKDNPLQDKLNNYVCLQSERKRLGKRVPVYQFPIKGDWLLKDQQLDTPVKPHEEWETYIPSNDEELSALKGPLTWRVHFRKGYNPASHRGVTTLVEVEFDSKDIEVDS